MSAFQILDKLLLILAAVMVLHAIWPVQLLASVTAPLQAIARFITPLGFHERFISVIAALWCLGIKLAAPIVQMLQAWS